MSRLWIVIAALTALALPAGAAAPVAGGGAPAAVQRVERFRGTTHLAGKEVQVAIDTWLIPNATKVAALPLSLRGVTVVELRGGSLVTIIDGQRQPRKAGDFWSVAAASTMALETDDDSAALQTTVATGG